MATASWISSLSMLWMGLEPGVSGSIWGTATEVSRRRPSSPYTPGNNPWSVAVGDFNLDGKLDFAICNDGAANNQPDSISIFLGNGDGTFTQAPGSPFALPANTGPLSLAVADFNGDGKPDLVSANLHNNTVSVFLGNGDGTFTVAGGSPIAVPIQPSSVAVADFNGDGKPDVAVGSYGGGVAILLGDGSGRLTSAIGSPIQAGPMPEKVAIGDFNGDGRPDIAVANRQITSIFPNYGNVTALLGNGDGTLSPSNNGAFQVGTDVSTVALADFNQDGKLDIAAISYDENLVTVLFGDGTGKFTPAPGSPFSGGNQSNRAAVGDIDGDGTPDLLVSGWSLFLNQSKPPVLSVAQSHMGNFTQGQTGAYTVTVSNQMGAGPTRGTVTVTETLPGGLSLVSMAGSGWSCSLGTCTRTDTLTNGVTYPPLTVTVSAALGAPLQVTSRVSVSSSGAATVTASDATNINQLSQTIGFGAISNSTYGAAPFALSASATSGLAVSFVPNTPSVCVVSGGTLAIAGAGTCSIVASQAGNSTLRRRARYHPILYGQQSDPDCYRSQRNH
jgi:uncharacterized repeat protein (TIGR01451 family)